MRVQFTLAHKGTLCSNQCISEFKAKGGGAGVEDGEAGRGVGGMYPSFINVQP